jgi:acyl carrier protein
MVDMPHDDFPRTPSTLKIKRYEVARQLLAMPLREDESAPDISAMSSLERVELLSQLEERCQVELDEEKFSRLTSTAELEEWLRQPAAIAPPADPGAPLSEWARSLPIRALRAAFQRGLALPLFRGFLPLTVTGLENLNGLEPPVIFASNHTSHLDTPAIFTALPREWSKRLAPAMMQDHFRAYFEPKRFSWFDVVSAGLTYFF